MTRLPTRTGAAWPATADPSSSPMERFFGGILRRLSEGSASEAEGAFCPVDIDEDDTHVYVDAEVPGFTRDEIDVRVQDQVLTIEAERASPEAKGRRHLAERSARRARRTFTLPASVDAANAGATLRDGILHLELPKAEPQKGHKIEVR